LRYNPSDAPTATDDAALVVTDDRGESVEVSDSELLAWADAVRQLRLGLETNQALDKPA
jgi:hypothetical protein